MSKLLLVKKVFITALILLWHTDLSAQELPLARPIEIQQILKDLGKRSGYKFVYKSDLFTDIPPQNITYADKEIFETLDILLEPLGFTYMVKGENIVIRQEVNAKPKAEAIPELIRKGVIKDIHGTPIAGVSLIVKGTNRGTITNVDGQFELNRIYPDEILEVSCVGYQPQSFKVLAAESIYDLTMQEAVGALDMVYVVGTRNANRSELDSTVPIDIISVPELINAYGRVEINQMLQYAAPSFNATKQSGSDGADHIDPTSLRGLGPDQMLVLINGKRRHQSSLINLFGTRGRGNSGTDMNAIPAFAIKRIEVLRDGASAQYGSDAIAGVINIILKDQTEGLQGGISFGAHSTAIGQNYARHVYETQGNWPAALSNINGKNRLDGRNTRFDGQTYKLDLNYGLKVGDKGGYLNLTTEYLTRDRTLRPSFEWRKGYGSAATQGFSLLFNSAIPVNQSTEFYFFGGRSSRNTDAYAFSRKSFEEGDNRAVPSIYPLGFTPRITSDVSDGAITIGLKNRLDNGWNIDMSNTYGKNHFQYYIKNTNNASLWTASPTEFDAGGHSLSVNSLGIDINRFLPQIARGLNIAYGAEYRTEKFEIFAGQEGSYATYDQHGTIINNPAIQSPALDPNGDPLPGGSQGFPGYSPENEVNRKRSNASLYFDSELNASKSLSLGAALRFENYNDFGESLNFKLASRYNIKDKIAFRGSVSTGFRAPSLAQVHYNLVFNNFVAGSSVRTLLAANTSAIPKSFGIENLRQETALNTSFGFTLNFGQFSTTIDAYSIRISDRIVLTDNFDATHLGIGVEAARFFTNGVDTKTRGVDIVMSYQLAFNQKNKLMANLAANFNSLTVEKIHNGDLNVYTFFSPFAEAYLKAAAPDHKIVFGMHFQTPKFQLNANITRFSQVMLQDFQWVMDAPTNEVEANELIPMATDVYEAAHTLDISLNYTINKHINMTFGGINIFNNYPTPQFDGWTDQGGFSDSVQMGSDGAYVFARLAFQL